MEKFLTILVKSAKHIFFEEHKSLEHKNANDILSEADLRLNEFFVDAIKQEYPKAKIIAEESKNEPLTDELTFVIDPLDGTCNYANKIPLCGIQVAVLKEKEPIISIIYLPYTDEFYYAKKGEGAYLNDKRITVDASIKHNDGILITSDFYLENKDVPYDKQYELVKSLKLDFLKTRLLGAACVDYTYLATSKAVGYICYYDNIWDVAPGLLIVQEAGLLVRRVNGKPYKFGASSLVVANNQETLDLILEKAKKIL